VIQTSKWWNESSAGLLVLMPSKQAAYSIKQKGSQVFEQVKGNDKNMKIKVNLYF